MIFYAFAISGSSLKIGGGIALIYLLNVFAVVFVIWLTGKFARGLFGGR